MIVVTDTSPLITLLAIGQIDLLPNLFGGVILPGAVRSELTSEKRGQQVRIWAEQFPGWVSVHNPNSTLEIRGLHSGEAAAISLAIELGADRILIDEYRGASRRDGWEYPSSEQSAYSKRRLGKASSTWRFVSTSFGCPTFG